jgi:hypothetical protein
MAEQIGLGIDVLHCFVSTVISIRDSQPMFSLRAFRQDSDISRSNPAQP